MSMDEQQGRNLRLQGRSASWVCVWLSWIGQGHAVPGYQEEPAGVQDEDSESAQKLAEIERLRQAERFMVVGTGEATCMGCGYEYQPKNGDPEYPITPGTYFTVRSLLLPSSNR